MSLTKEMVYGLYDQGWEDLIVPDAYSHPAKFSRKLAWVVKPFVRNKKLVDLPAMTLDLMLSQGWELVTWVDAMLIAEGVQASGFPEMVPDYQKKRVSFFRRLAERKGSPRIDAETVLVVRKG